MSMLSMRAPASSLKFFSIFLVVASAFLLHSSANAAIVPFEFENESQKQRFDQFSKTLRCPQCQNQNLEGSNSGLSNDLRRELHKLIIAGNNDEEIMTFMRDRYGNFISYNPPLDKATSLLWFGPVALMVLAIFALIMIQRRAKPTTAAPINEADRDKAKALLVDEDSL